MNASFLTASECLFKNKAGMLWAKAVPLLKEHSGAFFRRKFHGK